MANTSSTVDKALTLLGFFTERRSAAGLSELARLSGFNKATTLRFLNSLEAKGFVEQDAATRAYHLGPAFLRFAQVRESSFPFARAVRDILHGLVEKTGETAHVSALSGGVLANIDRVESKRSNRVVLDPGEVLPFHATASGIVYLAFADPDVTDAALKAPLTGHTAKTITDPAAIRARVDQARADGYARAGETYEDQVVGLALPYFGPSGAVCGAVAVALPKARASDGAETLILRELRTAARKLSAACGGALPDDFPQFPADDVKE